MADARAREPAARCRLALLVGAALGVWSARLELATARSPWVDEPHAGGLVAEVDLVAVPAQLPADDDRDDAALGRRRAHRDDRRPERAGDAGDRARVLGCR